MKSSYINQFCFRKKEHQENNLIITRKDFLSPQSLFKNSIQIFISYTCPIFCKYLFLILPIQIWSWRTNSEKLMLLNLFFSFNLLLFIYYSKNENIILAVFFLNVHIISLCVFIYHDGLFSMNEVCLSFIFSNFLLFFSVEFFLLKVFYQIVSA